MNSQAVNNKEVITKSNVDHFHDDNERKRRDNGLAFFDEEVYLVKVTQDIDFHDIRLTNKDYITVNRKPASDNEVSTKNYVDDEINKNTIIASNQTLRNYLKVSVENDIYNLTNINKIQLTDTTIFKSPKQGGYLLPSCRIFCINKNDDGKIQKFSKSTKTNSSATDSGGTSLLSIGDSFMYIETTSNNSGNYVFVSMERTDIIQISKLTFYYNRISILTSDSNESMVRFRIQLLLEDHTWSTQYTVPKKDQYRDISRDWTLLNLNFTVESYGIKLIYDQIDTTHDEMCFSNNTITYSVY